MLQAMEPHRPVAGAYLCLHRLKYDRRHFRNDPLAVELQQFNTKTCQPAGGAVDSI